MKNLIIVLSIIITVGFLNVSFADDVLTPDESIFKAGGINLSGDTVYLVDSQEFSPAIGYRIATAYNDMIELRAEFVPIEAMKTSEEDNKFGLGLGFNVPKLLELVGGTWKINLSPTLGIMALTDFNDLKQVQVAIYTNIVNIKFK